MRVDYHARHQGHVTEVAHLQIRRNEREKIAGMLSLGISFEDVLDSVQWIRVPAGQLTAMNLVTRKYLQNIAVSFGISRGERLHKDDAESVAAWVEKIRSGPLQQNLVRYVKYQGEECQLGIGRDDFMLVIMSDIQVTWVKKFGGAMKELALDSTHGTNEYNFQLTTLLVIDDHGEGLPGAFCYSSRVDETAISVFLHVCKEAIGEPLNDVILMTDDAEAFSNAWNVVMGPPAHRLLCSWHVDQAWRRNLPKVEGDAHLRAVVYKTLRTLMELSHPDSFNERLAKFLEFGKLDPKTVKFIEYFEREYACRPQLWAYCYRRGLRVHHNMHLEALHRVLKYIHMQGKKVKRMDKSIHALMRLLRSKMSDRILKMHKGKMTKHLAGINKRHSSSAKMDVSKCSCYIENELYAVKGSEDEEHLVQQEESLPHMKGICPLMCRHCGICIHAFSCTCMDYCLRPTICKHIHLVLQKFKPVLNSRVLGAPVEREILSPIHCAVTGMSDVTTALPSEQVIVMQTRDTSSEEINETEDIVDVLSVRNAIPNKAKSVEMVRQLLPVYLAKLDDADDEIAAKIHEILANGLCVIAAMEQRPEVSRLPASTSREPANKAIPTQRRFVSTKKSKLSLKRKANCSITKPSMDEKKRILSALDGDLPIISRASTPDHDYRGCNEGDTIAFEHSYVQPAHTGNDL